MVAKKKTNPQSESINDNEKLHSLKSLNSMLLKETVEKRQEVDSLKKVNVSLESELNVLKERAVLFDIEKVVAMEVKIGALERDLSRVLEEKERVKDLKDDEITCLIKKLTGLECEIGEEKFILSKVCEERDELRDKFDERVRVVSEMRLKLGESEKRASAVLEKSRQVDGLVKEKVEMERKMGLLVKEKEAVEKSVSAALEKSRKVDGLVKEKAEMERRMVLLVKEKELVEKSVIDLKGVVDELKRNIDKVVKEKTAVEGERKVLEKKKNELQSSVDGLNELVSKFRKSEEELLKKVADLEKKCVVGSDKEVKMSTEMDMLVKEKREFEESVRKLSEEKSLVTKDLNEALQTLECQKARINVMVNEQTRISDDKNQTENHIKKLQEDLERFSETIVEHENSSTVQDDKIKHLESEVSRSKVAFDQAIKERDSAQAALDGEKLKVKILSEKITKMEKGIEETNKKLSKIQEDSEKLVSEEKELEKIRKGLADEVAVIKKLLAITEKELDDSKAKVKSSEANRSQILKLLKNTSLICSSEADGNISVAQETNFGEGIKQHVKEVEAIKKAFKDKESTVDEMRKQLESLKDCVAKADKGKSFWTMVSSATTIVAAVSLAYVARVGH
ncbi:hypothetical protein Tco_1066975 [Tanacetum coccineum]|uniref:Uncharacterized protein n=1 Tax=Tanacetum coccineum TaxID=301880 RepID=A0ABQ5HBW8_9ASTR